MDNMTKIVLAVLLASMVAGCVSTENIGRGTLAVSSAMLAIDWSQTREMTGRGWTEQNPVLGAHPSAHAVDGYFLSVAVINAVVYMLLPSRYRAVAPSAIILVQLGALANNFSGGARMW